jgi:transcriptional regulator with XRE-family HTH domain
MGPAATSDRPRRRVSVGQLIAQYRKQRYRNGRPWSQQQLAFAIGSSQARISQIESDRSHPQFSTLIHISDALRLGQAEREELLALAMYQLGSLLPDEETVCQAVARLSGILEIHPYPVLLLDEGERIWHWNARFVPIWGPIYGASCHQDLVRILRGRTHLEAFFDPNPSVYRDRSSVWRASIEDIDRIVRRNVLLFRRAYRVRIYDPEMNRMLRRLKLNPDFLRLWNETPASDTGIVFIEHDTQVVSRPEWGRLQFQVWRTHPARDERFVVVHFTPLDNRTRAVLEQQPDAPARFGQAGGFLSAPKLAMRAR